MKRRSVQQAYQNIRPDEEAKRRMLRNILLSSEISPTGKDDSMKHIKMKPVVIAAIIALMVILMGCAVITLSLQEMKVGEFVYTEDAQLDDNGNLTAETFITKDMISLQGYHNSPGYLAAKEWNEFYQSYDADSHLIGDAEAAGYVAPRQYDAYLVFDQTMQDKLDEIARKYGLKLAGEMAITQSYQSEKFLDALGIETLHHSNTNAEIMYDSGYFYACGNFYIAFDVTLNQEQSQWPYEISTSMRYCDKAYLDTTFFTVDDIESVQQWNYTTTAGTDILIILGDDFAQFFCDREDSFISVLVRTDYWNASGEIEYMCKRDVELVADVIDFEVKPQKPDMEEALNALEEPAQQQQETWKKTVFTSYDAYIRNRIEALEDRAEELYYYKIDLNHDGIEEMITGSKDQINFTWTMFDGRMTIIMDWEEAFKNLEEQWMTMDKKPFTEYFSE